MSISVICGIDEAGRGPLAGPVSAGAVHIPCHTEKHPKGGWGIPGTTCRLFDSKQLTETEREAAFTWITTNCPHGISMVSASEIDRIGILEATNQAMQEALAQLEQTITPTYLLVDGRDAFWFNYPHSSLVGGDGLKACIAAASILAKVTRDRFMKEANTEFPSYGFAGHKGYGAPLHIEAIKKHGPCPLHRLTYLRNIVPSEPIGSAQ